MIRVGCSGWSYPHWRGRLYPEHGGTTNWLRAYSTVFDTVEVNASFYRLPHESTVRRWVETTPGGFLFAVKASRYLTHVKRLRDLAEGVERLTARIAPLRQTGKLGPLLWQLPASFRRDDGRLEEALEALGPGRHAFEFRHRSWFADDVYSALSAHGVALVVADRAPEPPSPWVQTTSWSYLRFHAGRARNGDYGPDELRAWAELLSAAPGDVFAYFNNDWEGFAVENARSLRAMLGAADARRTDPAGRMAS